METPNAAGAWEVVMQWPGAPEIVQKIKDRHFHLWSTEFCLDDEYLLGMSCTLRRRE